MALDQTKHHNGPCQNLQQIERMISFYTTKPALTRGLKAELVYNKLCLGYKTLRVTGTPLALYNRLREFHNGSAVDEMPQNFNRVRRQLNFDVHQHEDEGESEEVEE